MYQQHRANNMIRDAYVHHMHRIYVGQRYKIVIIGTVILLVRVEEQQENYTNREKTTAQDEFDIKLQIIRLFYKEEYLVLMRNVYHKSKLARRFF